MSVAGFSLSSVVGASAATVMPGPKRFPSADLLRVLDRNATIVARWASGDNVPNPTV